MFDSESQTEGQSIYTVENNEIMVANIWTPADEKIESHWLGVGVGSLRIENTNQLVESRRGITLDPKAKDRYESWSSECTYTKN